MPNPFFQVQLEGADSVLYDNITLNGVADANFLKVIYGKIKRNSQKGTKDFEIQLDNSGGTYNAVIKKAQRVDVWVGTALDGSNKIKRFSGTLFKIEKSKRHGGINTIKCGFKDATFNLMNTLVTRSFTAGDVLTSGGLSGYAATYTMNDYAEILKYIMSYKIFNPEEVNGYNKDNVQTTGSNILQPKIYSSRPTLEIFFELAAEAGYIVYVDTNNNLHFEPKTLAPAAGIINLSETVDFSQINELEDSIAEKTKVYMVCGDTTDGTPVVSHSDSHGVSKQYKTTIRRNIDIAPAATGATPTERYTNAKAMCRAAANAEYEKVKSKHDFRVSVFTFRDTEIGDLYTVTSDSLGLNPSATLKLIEIEETFNPKEPYEAQYILSTNLA